MEIIREADNPGALEGALGGCRLDYSTSTRVDLTVAVSYSRPASFEFLFDRIQFQDDQERANAAYQALRDALERRDLNFARLILPRLDLLHLPRTTLSLWLNEPWTYTRSPWNLENVKQFLRDHPAHVGALAPTRSDYYNAKEPAHVTFLIELGRFCDALSGLNQFDPTRLLWSLLLMKDVDDAEMAQLAQRLIQEGAHVSELTVKDFIYLRPNHQQTIELLRGNQGDELKDPGID